MRASKKGTQSPPRQTSFSLPAHLNRLTVGQNTRRERERESDSSTKKVKKQQKQAERKRENRDVVCEVLSIICLFLFIMGCFHHKYFKLRKCLPTGISWCKIMYNVTVILYNSRLYNQVNIILGNLVI